MNIIRNTFQWEWERSMLQDIKQCEACRSAAITVLTSYEQDDCSDCQEIKLQVNIHKI